jgi:hypothetical protein
LITNSKIYCKNKTRQNKYSDSMADLFCYWWGGFSFFFNLSLKILHTKLLFPSYHLFFISNMWLCLINSDDQMAFLLPTTS